MVGYYGVAYIVINHRLNSMSHTLNDTTMSKLKSMFFRFVVFKIITPYPYSCFLFFAMDISRSSISMSEILKSVVLVPSRLLK